MEHEKLRKRLQNIGKHTTEYRMTVKEAKALLEEFDDLKELVDHPKIIEVPAIEEETGEIVIRILDGGSL